MECERARDRLRDVRGQKAKIERGGLQKAPLAEKDSERASELIARNRTARTSGARAQPSRRVEREAAAGGAGGGTEERRSWPERRTAGLGRAGRSSRSRAVAIAAAAAGGRKRRAVPAAGGAASARMRRRSMRARRSARARTRRTEAGRERRKRDEEGWARRPGGTRAR